MNAVKILSSEDVKRLVSMSEAIDTVITAYTELSDKSIKMPIRTVTNFGDDGLTLFYKPSLVSSIQTTGIKLLSHHKQGAKNDHPALQGIVVLINSENNSTKAIIDGAYLTALRTGAASGVATRYLAREDASVLAIFGAGAQSYTQFEAICSVRRISKAYIFANTPESVKRFIDFYKDKTDVELVAANNLDILSEVDIICTVTPSEKPLFSVENLKKGVHINAIGSYSPTMQELPDEIFLNASLFVDHKESSFSESGDIIIPKLKGLLPQSSYKGEIGEVITKRILGRISESETTVFKSVGIAIQDLITANYAYEKACLNNIGTSVSM